ncbi:MAG: oxidoreductase [Alphaproteobacteria bacterium]|nr:oxidoreductase [Alphaproteobacteria bacterium]
MAVTKEKTKKVSRSTGKVSATVRPRHKPKIAVWKFASCDGCQLSLLACEDELLDVVGQIEIAYFLEATTAVIKGPYDISLVEGSITTEHDIHRLRKIRQQSKKLIAIGACATSGGIQALRNFADVDDYTRAVYARPDYISTLRTSTPIQEHVPVDFELRGCPINKNELLELINATLNNRTPNISHVSQCVECKRAGTVCVMVSKGIPCLGPVTHAGCGNLCPSTDRGCFGCFGPSEAPNGLSLAKQLEKLGMTKHEIRDFFRSFNANAGPFRKTSEAYD